MIVVRIRSAFVLPVGSLSEWARFRSSSVTRVMRSCVVPPPFQPNRLYSWTRPLLLQQTPTVTVSPDTSANDSTEYAFSKIELKPGIIRHAWSTEDIVLLKQLLKEGQSITAAHKHFPRRTKASVSKRMYRLRLSENIEQKRIPFWSHEEDAIIHSCIRKHITIKEARAYLSDRTKEAIRFRIRTFSGKVLVKPKRLTVRWTPEDVKIMYKLLAQDKSSNEIFQHFPRRSMESIISRIAIMRQQVVLGLDPLLITSRQTPKVQAPEQMASDAEEKDQVDVVKQFWPQRVQRWTPAEDKLLEKLVKDFISQGHDMDEKVFWDNISRTAFRFQRNGTRFTRSSVTCRRRWEQLHATPSSNGLRKGQWDIEEDNKFRQAVQEFIGNDFQVRVDVLEVAAPCKRPLSNADEEDPRPGIRVGSPEMKKIIWHQVAANVGTRNTEQCRKHLYRSYHNGKHGSWSADELKRFEDGIAEYGENWSAVSLYVGTRTSEQVSTLQRRRNRQKMGKSKKSDN